VLADWEPLGLEASEPHPTGRATLALAGDLMVGRGLDRRLERKPKRAIWRGFGSLLAGVDLLAFNLESALTDSVDKWAGKKFRFRLPPHHAHRALRSLPLPAGRPLVAAVANNHALDFGSTGLTETLETLDGLDITAVGGGPTWHEARAARVVTTTGGVRVGFLAATDHCSCGDVCAWAAGPDRPGVWHVDISGRDWDDALAAVRALDPVVDHLVFSIHWGPNYTAGAPMGWMRDFARALVEAGVDVVHGHSAHMVLPVETVEGRTVLYSTGGLLDDYVDRRYVRNDLGFVALVHLGGPGTSQRLEIAPIRIGSRGGRFAQVLAADDPDHAEVYERAGLAPPE